MAARFTEKFYTFLLNLQSTNQIQRYENNAQRDRTQIENLLRWGMWGRPIPDFDADNEGPTVFRTMVTILHATQDRVIAVLASGSLAYAVFAVAGSGRVGITNETVLMRSHGTACQVRVMPRRSYRIRLRQAADPPEGLHYPNEIPCPWRYIPSEHIPEHFSYIFADIRTTVVDLVANNTIPNYPMPDGVTC